MLLKNMLDTWYLRERQISARGIENLQRTVTLFTETLGHDASTDDLQDAIVSEWLCKLEDRYADRTVYGHRASLLTIWRFAVDHEFTEEVPKRVRKIRKPKPNPVAWTTEEWGRLIQAADALDGRFPNLKLTYSEYFGTLLRCAYDTGLRRGDLFQLGKQDVRSDGRIRMVQHKTSDPHQPAMRPTTLDRFHHLPGQKPLRWRGNVSGMYYWFGVLRRSARLGLGALHQTRRTGATMVVRSTGSVDSARKYLGHRTGDMWRHYVDMGIADQEPVLPPTIEGSA